MNATGVTICVAYVEVLVIASSRKLNLVMFMFFKITD